MNLNEYLDKFGVNPADNDLLFGAIEQYRRTYNVILTGLISKKVPQDRAIKLAGVAAAGFLKSIEETYAKLGLFGSGSGETSGGDETKQQDPR